MHMGVAAHTPLHSVGMLLILLLTAPRQSHAVQTRARTAPLRPNIIWIMADDLGWGEVGLYPSTPPDRRRRISTPNLDAFGRSGIQFSHAYAGYTVCAPSRTTLMTGFHSGHFQRENIPGISLATSWSNANLTLPAMLQNAGYVTAGIGKLAPLDAPTQQGFDYFIGQLDQALCHNMYPRMIDTERGAQTYNLSHNYKIITTNASEARLECMRDPGRYNYTVDITHSRSLAWIAAQAQAQRTAAASAAKPFFLYEAFTVPHAGGWNHFNASQRMRGGLLSGAPVPTDGIYANESSKWPTVEMDHASVITYLDRYVGELVALLAKLGLEKDTIVFFASDNGAHLEGGHDYKFFNSTGGLLGHKRSLYEGGVRSPTMVSWPGAIKPARISNFSWAFWDIMPTLAELAGVEPSKLSADLDGVSIVPTLMGSTTQPPKEYLFWTWTNTGVPPLGSHATASDNDAAEWRLEQSDDGTALHVRLDSTSGLPTGETRQLSDSRPGRGYAIRTTDASTGTMWKGVVNKCGVTGKPSVGDAIMVYNLSDDPFEKRNINETVAGKKQRAVFARLLAKEISGLSCECFQCPRSAPHPTMPPTVAPHARRLSTVFDNTSTGNDLENNITALSLDGVWDFQCDSADGTTDSGMKSHIRVPAWWDSIYGGNWTSQCNSAVYSTKVAVPPTMSGKALYLRFASVEQVATVFVNGKLCGSHVGGGLAFELLISSNAENECAATRGTSFALRVHVSGGGLPPISTNSHCATLAESECPHPFNLTDLDNCTWDKTDGPPRCVGVPSSPVGWYGQERGWGIGDSVTLRGVGNVHIENIYAHANVNTVKLVVNVTLRNLLGSSATVDLTTTAVRKSGQILAPLPRLGGHTPTTITGEALSVGVPAHGTASVQITLDWSRGELWFPDHPALYLLQSEVTTSHNALLLDSDTTVIGFKQVTVRGEHLFLNGLRLNLRGTSIIVSSQRRDQAYGPQPGEGYIANFRRTAMQWKTLGVNVLRVHQGPAPELLLEIADDVGLMIVEESPILARKYVPSLAKQPARNAEYVKNSLEWIKQWVVQRRNHAAIVYWSAENENGPAGQNQLSVNQIQTLASMVHELDGSRPVMCSGDQIGSAEHLPSAPHAYTVTDYHYPEGYSNSWSEPLNDTGSGTCYCRDAAICGCKLDGVCGCRSIYLPLHTVGRPNSVGEVAFIHNVNGEPNNVWHGLIVRGFRYMNWSDIRPYILDWALPKDTRVGERIVNTSTAALCLRKGMNAVALFDYAYDDLGPCPAGGACPDDFEAWPSLALRSADPPRRFVAYNDEFVGITLVSITLVLVSNQTGAQLGSTRFALDIPVGTHANFQCSFVASEDSVCVNDEITRRDELLDLHLSTAKGTTHKFHETRRFRATGDCVLTAEEVKITCNNSN